MRIVFDKKKRKDVVGDSEFVGNDEFLADKPVSSKRDVGIGVAPPTYPIPPSPPPVSKPFVNSVGVDVADGLEAYKNFYGKVFGVDSVIPSSSSVIELNLLFALLVELRGLRKDLEEAFKEE